MYGNHGMGSMLGASATIVGSTAGLVLFSKSRYELYVKLIAAASYVLLLAVAISFFTKRRARAASKRHVGR